MLELARALRARIEALPDGDEIMGTVRAEVEPAAHPPEPPPRHGELIAEVLELLDDPRLSSDQALELRRAFLDLH
jgi:hypothetical protein